jgi:hypothetical protein
LWLMASARWRHVSCGVLLERHFWWSFYFQRFVVPNIRWFTLSRFLFLRLLKLRYTATTHTHRRNEKVSTNVLEGVRACIPEQGRRFQNLS